MKCSTVKNIIPDYAAGDLSAEKAALVEKHLSECASCRDELAFYRSYLVETSGMKSMRAPNDFTKRLHSKLGIKPFRKKLLETLFLPIRSKIPLEAAGVLALSLIIFFFWRPFEPSTLHVVSESEIKPAAQPAAQIPMVKNRKSDDRIASRRMKSEPAVKKTLAAQPLTTVADSLTVAPAAENMAASEEAAPSEKKIAAGGVASSPSEAKISFTKREVFWIAMAKDSIASEKDESFQAVRQDSDSMKKSDSDDKQKTGSSAPESRKERSGRQWLLDERIASLVIEAHGSIVGRVRAKDSAAYTIEIPLSSRESFLRGIKKLGGFSDSGPVQDDTKHTVAVKIILIMRR
jgi:hypothetical protein